MYYEMFKQCENNPDDEEELLFYFANIISIFTKNENMIIIMTSNNIPVLLIKIIDKMQIMNANFKNLLITIDGFIESKDEISEVIKF